MSDIIDPEQGDGEPNGDGQEQGRSEEGGLHDDSDAESFSTRSGDPSEFDEERSGDVVDPDKPGRIEVPPGLLRRLLADPRNAPELLAARAVERFADRAAHDVRLLRDRNPNATDRQLALYFKRKYSRAARWEGAGTGVTGILGSQQTLCCWPGFKIGSCYRSPPPTGTT